MLAARRRRIALALGITVAAAVILVLALWPTPSGSSSDCAPPAAQGYTSADTYTLARCDSVVPLSSHSVMPYQIARVSDTERVEGQYVGNLSTYGSFDGYLLNTTEYSQLMSHPYPTAALPDGSYLFACGAVPECNLSVAIPGSPIDYYIVLVNYGNLSLSVEWTEALTLFYVPH